MNKTEQAHLELYRFMDNVDTAVDIFKPELNDPFVKYVTQHLKLTKKLLEEL